MVFVAIACVLALWALNLRRALVDQPYRSRALWTAIGALTIVSYAVAGYVDSVFGQVPSTYTSVAAEAVVWGFVFLGLYGWIVSNANVAVAADYFNRDVLYWKKGGRIATTFMVFASYAMFNIPTFWFSQANLFYEDLISGIGYSFTIFVCVYTVAVLSITYLRIMDRRIKTYTLWVALSAAFVFLSTFSPSSISAVPLVACVYFIYRSVGSLAIRTTKLDPLATDRTSLMQMGPTRHA